MEKMEGSEATENREERRETFAESLKIVDSEEFDMQSLSTRWKCNPNTTRNKQEFTN